jgi:hypothetical protein
MSIQTIQKNQRLRSILQFDTESSMDLDEGRKAGKQLSEFMECTTPPNHRHISIALFGMLVCQTYFMKAFDVVNYRKRDWVLVCFLVGKTKIEDLDDERVSMAVLSPLDEEMFASELCYASEDECESMLSSNKFRKQPLSSDKGVADYSLFIASFQDALGRMLPAEFTAKFRHQSILALASSSSVPPHQQQQEPKNAPKKMIWSVPNGVWEYVRQCHMCESQLNDIQIDRSYDDTIGFESNSILPTYYISLIQSNSNSNPMKLF